MGHRHKQRNRDDADAIRITTAPVSRGDDLALRQRRYIISMSIRTLCFIGAVVVALTDGPRGLMWALIFGSLVLPYFAVVMANSAGPMTLGEDLEGPDFNRRELPPQS